MSERIIAFMRYAGTNRIVQERAPKVNSHKMYTVKVGIHQCTTRVGNTDDQVSAVDTRCEHDSISRCLPEQTSQLYL